MRRAGVDLAEHALDLGQFLHQMTLGVQPAGGIGNQHIDVARLGGLQGIEDHRCGIGAAALGHHRHLIALTPGLELFDRGRPKGVAGRQHHTMPGELVAHRQFANGGGLAGTIDAHRENHKRPGRARNLQGQRVVGDQSVQ